MDDGLLKAGGLQLPSHFPKGGAPEWNRSGDLVDMEPKRYPTLVNFTTAGLICKKLSF